MQFLGEDANFWLELKLRADTLNTTNWIREVATLRAKVSFYESRIKELNKFMTEV